MRKKWDMWPSDTVGVYDVILCVLQLDIMALYYLFLDELISNLTPDHKCESFFISLLFVSDFVFQSQNQTHTVQTCTHSLNYNSISYL